MELMVDWRPRKSSIGLDVGQLRERLALTPSERLRTFQGSLRATEQLRAVARRVDA
jgi:hypothetical protein